MVARVDTSRYTSPHPHVAYQKPVTFGSPKLALKTTCSLMGSHISASSYPPTRAHSTKSSFLTANYSPPVQRVSFVLPSTLSLGNMMSNQVIQSFRNRMLFAMPACASIRGLSIPPTLVMNLTARNYETKLSSECIKVTSQEGKPNNDPDESCAIGELLTSDNKQNITSCQPHQRTTESSTNTLCGLMECDSSSSMNLISESDLTTRQDNQQEAAMNGTFWETDSEQSEDSELSHSEYESDLDEDFVHFSDESSEHKVAQDHLCHPDIKYVSLCSSESGYFECATRSVHLDNDTVDVCWSSDDDENKDCDVDVWSSFEVQALSPMISCQRGNTSPRNICTSPSPNICTVKSNTSTHCQNGHYEHDEELPYKELAKDKKDYCVATQMSDFETFQSHKKQVRFKPDHELVQVHTIVAWEYAYRAARKGPWEVYARDRAHFRRRINCVATVLEPCLSAKMASCCVGSNDS